MRGLRIFMNDLIGRDIRTDQEREAQLMRAKRYANKVLQSIEDRQRAKEARRASRMSKRGILAVLIIGALTGCSKEALEDIKPEPIRERVEIHVFSKDALSLLHINTIRVEVVGGEAQTGVTILEVKELRTFEFKRLSGERTDVKIVHYRQSGKLEQDFGTVNYIRI